MKKQGTFLKEYIHGQIMTYNIQHKDPNYYENRLNAFNHKPLLTSDQVSKLLQNWIKSGHPFMVCRFGANELATVKTFDFELKNRYEHQLSRMHTFAGLFPETEEMGSRFTELMIEGIAQADLIGIWPQPFEEYYTGTYGSPDLEYTFMRNLNPWINPDNPWTAALEGKKVLVIHPFEESIRNLYAKREHLFPGTDILPEFSLDTLKSIQTSGGGVDDRFENWFEAFEWMKQEILKRDFDIAILGCGAYGFPLAAEIKKAGKQAVHFGGATQLLFGIMGNRWNHNPVVQNLVNEYWTRPLDSEKPKDADKVEKSCYW